jgi:NADH dehydrogenase
MTGQLVTVFGGSGFIGRKVVQTLARAGWRIRVPVRRPHLAQKLRVLGNTGQIQLVQGNVRFADSVAEAVRGADAVVNLVGLLFEKGKQTFAATQAGGAANIAQAAKAAGITRVVHISAIGADARGKARYARTKVQAEEAFRAAVPSSVILRPSIVFGPDDDFFNRFADMARSAPALPLIGGGRTRFQPVHVGDVADAVRAALERPDAAGRTFELGGPGVYTFRELLAFITATIERRRALVPLPFFVAQPLGLALGTVSRLNPFGGPPLTADQVEMLKRDNVVGLTGDSTIGTFADLGITQLESIEAVVPGYLWRFRPYGQFESQEARHGR